MMLNQTLTSAGAPQARQSATSPAQPKRLNLTADQRAIVRHQFETNPQELDAVQAECQRLLGVEITAKQIYSMAYRYAWRTPAGRLSRVGKWSMRDGAKDDSATDEPWVTPTGRIYWGRALPFAGRLYEDGMPVEDIRAALLAEFGLRFGVSNIKARLVTRGFRRLHPQAAPAAAPAAINVAPAAPAAAAVACATVAAPRPARATCAWIVGQRQQVGLHYCRQPVAAGYAFCPDHCHVAYVEWPKPRDAEGE